VRRRPLICHPDRSVPGFPVELVGVGEAHAAFLTESRTRSHGWSHVQEIRVGMTKGRGTAHLSSRTEGWTGGRRLSAIFIHLGEPQAHHTTPVGMTKSRVVVEVDGQNQHNSNHLGFICPRSLQRIQQVALSPFAPMPGTLEGAAPRLFRPMYAGARETVQGSGLGCLHSCSRSRTALGFLTYSVRKACIGSTDAARLAGMSAANIPDKRRMAGPNTRILGSFLLTP
jgi:hypothetical protein